MGKQRVNKAAKKKARQVKREQRHAAQSVRKERAKQEKEAKYYDYAQPAEFYEMQNPFPLDVAVEERQKLVAGLVEQGKQDVEKIGNDLSEWFDKYDSCYLLSSYAFYFLTEPYGSTRENEGDTEHMQHHLELLHAIALTRPRKIDVTPLSVAGNKLGEQLSRLGTAIQFSLLNVAEGDSSEELRKKSLIATARIHTAAVRNWAYHYQMMRVTTELMIKIDAEFETVHDLKASGLAKILMGLPMLVNERFETHVEKLRYVVKAKKATEIMDAYHESFPDMVRGSEEQLKEMFANLGGSTKNLKSALIMHSDLRLQDIYTFDLDDAAKIYGEDVDREKFSAVLDSLSYQFGDLDISDVQNFVLNNPMSKKPFIKLEDGKYFCPSIASVPHYTLEILENLISENDRLREAYTKRKGEYCEEYVRELVARNFPGSAIHHGFKWERTDIPGKIFETDNLVLAGNFALVLESKSGKLTAPARRGAEDRLQKHIDELVLEASEQAFNLIEAVQKGTIKNIRSADGRPMQIDFSDAKHFIPLVVTLENLSTLGNARTIYEAGMSKGRPPEKIATSITMTDLDSVFQILPYEAMKLHYLIRRREFAMHMDINGDEMDLLNFYLENGFNIGETEYAGNRQLSISALSRNVDKYFILHDEVEIDPPKPNMSDLWIKLLSHLDSRRRPGWVEASFALLNCDREGQEKFEANIKQLTTDTVRGRLGKYPVNPYMSLTTGPKEHKTGIVFYPYKDLSREKRNDILANIMEGEAMEGCQIKLGFALDVKDTHKLYDVMAVTKDSVLMEEPLKYISYDQEQ